MLPMMLTINNELKRVAHWLRKDEWVDKRELERAVKEIEVEKMEELI